MHRIQAFELEPIDGLTGLRRSLQRISDTFHVEVTHDRTIHIQREVANELGRSDDHLLAHTNRRKSVHEIDSGPCLPVGHRQPVLRHLRLDLLRALRGTPSDQLTPRFDDLDAAAIRCDRTETSAPLPRRRREPARAFLHRLQRHIDLRPVAVLGLEPLRSVGELRGERPVGLPPDEARRRRPRCASTSPLLGSGNLSNDNGSGSTGLGTSTKPGSRGCAGSGIGARSPGASMAGRSSGVGSAAVIAEDAAGSEAAVVERSGDQTKSEAASSTQPPNRLRRLRADPPSSSTRSSHGRQWGGP